LIPIVPGRGDEIVGELEDIGERFEYFLIYATGRIKGRPDWARAFSHAWGEASPFKSCPSRAVPRFSSRGHGNSG